MKITELWIYPIKALRGIQLDSSKLGAQGLQHDRRFMLWKVEDSGEMTKIQLSGFPQSSLFAQELVGDGIHVRYVTPEEPLVPARPEHDITLEVPLNPDLKKLEAVEVNLHQSMVTAYRMGPEYDSWFSACFGFNVAFTYIGDGRRPILGTFSPKSRAQSKGWLSSMASYVTGATDEEDWLTFTDCAPLLITTQKSLDNVSARLADVDAEMYKFRPNIVVDGEVEWDEDFWAELAINQQHTLALTKLCNRCTSLNVDYATGRAAKGERGMILKKLMSDRRVDAGLRFSPTFGRYAFLTSTPRDDDDDDDDDNVTVSVGDSVEVTKRTTERPVWDWPLKDPRAARYYHRV